MEKCVFSMVINVSNSILNERKKSLACGIDQCNWYHDLIIWLHLIKLKVILGVFSSVICHLQYVQYLAREYFFKKQWWIKIVENSGFRTGRWGGAETTTFAIILGFIDGTIPIFKWFKYNMTIMYTLPYSSLEVTYKK